MTQELSFEPSIRTDEPETGGRPEERPAQPETASRSRLRRAMTHLPAGPKPEAALLAVGRALFGGYFLYNGLNHFKNREMLSGYAASKGVPMPDVAVLGSGAMILAGGLSLLTGIYPKAGASFIAGFLIGVTPRMHDFWNVQDEQQRMSEFINFSKNVALLGGACLAAAVPEPWPGSVPVARADDRDSWE